MSINELIDWALNEVNHETSASQSSRVANGVRGASVLETSATEPARVRVAVPTLGRLTLGIRGYLIHFILFSRSVYDTLFFFYKNHAYKNVEAQISEKIRTC